MGKLNYIHKGVLVACSIVMGLGIACKKEALSSKELLVYVTGDQVSKNNMIAASLTQTPVSVWGNTDFEIPVLSTRAVVADVDVSIDVDEQLVSQFDSINNKKCLLLPASAYQINSNQHKISAGASESDPLKIRITDPASLKDTNGYVLPLTITKIAGRDKGVTVSTNLSTAYLYIPYKYTNIDSTAAPLTGTAMDRTGWSVSVSNTTSGALGPAMLDGDNSKPWRSSNSSTAAKWAIVNMGTMQTIKGFVLCPDYVSTGENATKITVSTSTDNVKWIVQGTWSGTGPATGSSAASPDLKGVNFIAPVQAQYFRFDVTAWVSGSRAGIGELNAIQ